MANKVDKVKTNLERDNNPFESSLAPTIPALTPVQGFAPRSIPGRTTITAPQPQPQPVAAPKPSIGSSLARGIGRAISRLFVFFTPMNSGPDGTGDLTPGPYVPPLPELEEVTVTPPAQPWPELEEVTVRPPRKPTSNPPATVPSDPYNFGDLLDFSRPIKLPRIGYPDDPLGSPYRPAPQPLSPPGELPTPTGPEVFADPLPDRVSVPKPSTPAPRIFPDPFGVPTADPFRPASPRPRPTARPGTRPGSDPLPNPRPGTRPPPLTPLPELPGFPSIPDNYRPPAAPRPGLPDFLADPSPDLLEDPMQDPDGDPAGADPCNCDKPAKKKKKPPKERAVCKQGTYTQRKKGIKYSPRRTVPCEEGQVVPERTVRKKSKAKTQRRSPALITI